MPEQERSPENENEITYFAATDARNKRVPFGIKSKDRLKHVYVIGKTGMGKSTMLENMAIQDIQKGRGLAFIDPHGKTAELLLDYVPAERVRDVLYFAPFDTDFPVSFNVMEDVGPDKRHLVSNGLMSAFKKIWVDAWSARMEYILNNILLALLEYPDSTLIGVNRMLADKDYRKRVVENVSDVSVKAFWTDEFARYGDRYMQEAGAAIQNKIGQFIANPLVRNIIGQPKSTFDLRKMTDERKVLILNLSKGRVGEANANLLGSMLITKIYLGAMSRADASERELRVLPNFYLYVDEFQSFANESFADILSEARKYKLNLTIAHQYIEQMSEEVRAAVFGNVGTMVSFRIGAYDAEVLEKEFAPQFTAQDMVNLGQFQVYLKLMIDGVSSQPFSATTLPPIQMSGTSYREAIISLSRSVFARPRDVVEKEIREWHAPILPPPGPQKREERGQREERRFPPISPAHRENPRPPLETRQPPAPAPAPAPVSRASKPPFEQRRIEPSDRRSSEAEIQKAISLSYLKQRSEKREQPPKKKLPQTGGLREALAEALKEYGGVPAPAPAPTPAPVPAPVQTQKQPQESVPKPKESPVRSETVSQEPKKPKEVPEEVLKKILNEEK